MLTTGIPGYRIVVKLGYLGSRTTIDRLTQQKFGVHYFDELLYRSVDAEAIKELAIGWHKAVGSEVLPRFTATLYGEAFSMEAAAKMVDSIGEHCRLISVSIRPATLYPELSIL